MRALLIAALMLTGCAAREPAQPPVSGTHTTVYRYSSTPQACAPQAAGDSSELRRITKSRDEWKKYAEGLELLTPKESNHAPNP